MLLTSVITQKKVNAFVNTKSIAIKCPRMSATTNFSSKKMNTIAPEYKRLFEMVCESLRERIEVQPFFLTLRQIPKHVSKMIAKIATKTNGFTGAKIANVDSKKIDSLDFIKIPLQRYYIRCRRNVVHSVPNKFQYNYIGQFVVVNLCRDFLD